MNKLSAQEIVERVEGRFKARTRVGCGPRPEKVSVSKYGQHASYVRDGYRVWGFVFEDGRDAFVNKFIPWAEKQ
jgi:hypothetical protein